MRFRIALVAMLLTLGLGVRTAFADSPHFISATSGLSGSSLTCTFKEAGLGTTVATANVTCTASATAVFECVNGGNNHPQAANKETVNTVVNNSGTFPVRNGSVTGTITVAAPGAGNFTCPGGQRLVLKSVTYSGITVSGEGASALTSPSSQMFTNPNAP